MKIAIEQLERSKQFVENEIASYTASNEQALNAIEHHKTQINEAKKRLQELELAITLLKGNTNDSQSKKINGKR